MKKRIKKKALSMKEAAEKTVNKLKMSFEKNGIKKQYPKTSPAKCKVTFRLPKDAAPDAQKVTIAGDFNGWDKENALMTRFNTGDFVVSLELEQGKEYRYRYFIDGVRWENDWYADKYVPNAYGCDDSVVII
jgi:1,4-alpha-glucan branching enzyme